MLIWYEHVSRLMQTSDVLLPSVSTDNLVETSHQNWCHSLCFRVSITATTFLQVFLLRHWRVCKVLHATATVMLNHMRRDHVSSTLCESHWLPITTRIDYKFCLLVYKTLWPYSVLCRLRRHTSQIYKRPLPIYSSTTSLSTSVGSGCRAADKTNNW